MYERLNDNAIKPNLQEAMEFIGSSKELFENIDNFLVNELNADKEIEFSGHDKCWGMGYHVKEKPICGIYFEKDAVFVVVGFSLAKDNIKGFENMYNSLSPYAKMCVDNSPWRHVGFVEYRVLTTEHLDDLIIMLNCRANQKQKRKPIK
jgi:hypothetical protein